MDLAPDDRELFDDLARRARELGPEDLEPEAPPAGLWDDIAAAVAADGDRGDGHATAATAGAGGAAAATVTPLAAARRSRPAAAVVLAVAAVSALIAGVLTWAVVSGGDDEPAGTVVATAALEPLTEGASTGRAELVDDDGELSLRVDVADPGDPGDDGFLEVWVIDPDVSQLISLGPVRPDGTYDLPPGIDPEAFPIVDLSVEPLDGDPTHSGASTVRGQLRF